MLNVPEFPAGEDVEMVGNVVADRVPETLGYEERPGKRCLDKRSDACPFRRKHLANISRRLT